MTIKKNVEISISSETRQVFFEDNFLGLTGENLQGYVVFSFKDSFVSGIPRVELIQEDNKYYITEIETENETYKLPIKSSLLTSNNIQMQLVITEAQEGQEIPIFKSKTFYLYVAESINAITTIPEEYETWIDILNAKVLEINEKLEQCDTAITQANTLDLDVSKSGGATTVTITKKDGTVKSEDILDATINGVNTLTIEAGTNIELEQEDSTLTINNTYDDSQILSDISDLQTNKADKSEIPDVSSFITKDVNNLTYYTTTSNMNTAINDAVGTETTNRQIADNNLQGQIDAITASSDVVDIVGTYTDLQNYDTSKLTEDDVIKVLEDSTHNDALSYYRWSSNSWSYIGSEGPFYTKSETNTLLDTKQATIDSSHKLSADLVDDTNTTNKFTNASEKETWNNKVGFTDYATSSSGGIIKLSNANAGTSISNGILIGSTKTYEQYVPASNQIFVSKGTLENVITGKELTNKTYVDNADALKEDKTNKVVSISSSSTNTEYPSAKCVYDSQEIQNAKIEKLEGNQIKGNASGTTIDLTDAYDTNLEYLETDKETTQITSLLPSGYTQVDYIESSGTQYINTGIYSKSSVEIDCDFKSTDTSATRNYLFGAYNSNINRMQFSYSSEAFYGYGNNYITDNLTVDNNKHNFNLKNGIFKIDNNQIKEITSNDFESPNSYVFLLAVNNAGTATFYSYIKLYKCKIYNNNNLVRDFIPCYRNSDNEVGLYDLVNDIFYANAGTGSFTYGPTATIPNPDFPQDVNVVEGYRNLWNNTLEVAERDTSTGAKTTTSNVWVVNINAIDVKDNTTYTISQKETPTQYRFSYFNNSSYLSYLNTTRDTNNGYKNYTFTTPNNCNKLYIQFRSTLEKIAQGSYTMTTSDITNVQLTESSNVLPYVPYGSNYIILDNVGKNYFNQAQLLQSLNYNSSTGYYEGTTSTALNTTITGIFKDNTQYTFKFTGYKNTDQAIQAKFTYTDNTETHINIPNNTSPTTEYITSTSGKTVQSFSIIYIRARIVHLKDVMLYEGNNTNENFESYQSFSIPLDLNNNFLAKQSTYKDYYFIAKKDETIAGTQVKKGKHYIYKVYAKKYFKDLSITYDTTNSYFYAQLNDMYVEPSANIMFKGYCNIYKPTTSQNNANWGNKGNYLIGTRQTTDLICWKDNDYNDTTAYKTARGDNYFYYLLATPYIVEVPTTDIELFNGVNHLSNSEDATMNIVYVKDINIVINNINNAILEIGGE